MPWVDVEINHRRLNYAENSPPTWSDCDIHLRLDAGRKCHSHTDLYNRTHSWEFVISVWQRPDGRSQNALFGLCTFSLNKNKTPVCLFWDRVPLGSPGTHCIDQAGLELRDPPASDSPVLGLKACATTPLAKWIFLLGCCSCLLNELLQTLSFSILFKLLSNWY